MKNNTARRIEKRLLAGDVPEPPVELLERLKEDIPDRLGTGTGSKKGEPTRGIGRRPAIRLLAASVFLAVVGGVVVYRVMERTRQVPLSTSLDEAVMFENEVEELGQRTDSPAPLESMAADPGRAQGVVDPPARRITGEQEADLADINALPEYRTREQAKVAAPLPKDKGKRVEDVLGSASQIDEGRQRALATPPVGSDADGRAKNKDRPP